MEIGGINIIDQRLTLEAGNTLNIVSVSGQPSVAIAGMSTPSIMRGSLMQGLTLTNNSSGAVDIAAGTCTDSTYAVIMQLSSALTGKVLATAWSAGSAGGLLDTGAVANTTYHIFLINNPTTGATDVIASTSATSPTMPSGYVYKRRIGSIVRVGGAILLFVQDGDKFQLNTVVNDVNANNPGISAVSRTLTVPLGIRVEALMRVTVLNASNGVSARCLISDLSVADATPTDTAPGTTTSEVFNGVGGGDVRRQAMTVNVYTNTSSQVRSRLDASDANVTLYINTYGWIDRRGRDD